MNKLLIFILLIYGLGANASHHSNFPAMPENRIKADVGLKDITAENLISLLPYSSDYTLEIDFSISSKTSVHHHFIILYKSIPLVGGRVQAVCNKEGVLREIIFSEVPEIEAENIADPDIRDQSLKNELEADSVINSRLVWVSHNHQLQKARALEVLGADHMHQELIYNNEEILYHWDKIKRVHQSGPHDTTATAYVFAPDPLSTAMVNYGNPYIDANDADIPELNAERKLRNILVSYVSGVFVLENDYIKIVDISPPAISPVSSTNNQFHFTRSQSGFEDVNAIYHITEFKLHLNKLGYTHIPGYQIEVDVHALSNDDNSMFMAGTNPKRLLFGEGNVDDAEDADVLIHEYVHACILGATGNNNGTNERNTIEESLGDYFAASYSSIESTYGNDRVYNWDGHNPFWPGRLVSSHKDYTQLSFNDIYSHTDIWASCLMEINKALGRDIADEIVMEAIFKLGPSTSMEQMALYIVEADSLLNNGQNRNTIVTAFVRRNILDSAYLGNKKYVAEKSVNLSNTFAFANGGSLLVQSGEEIIKSMRLYDISGKPVLHSDYTLAVKELEISSANISGGVYILDIHLDNGKSSRFKVMKF